MIYRCDVCGKEYNSHLSLGGHKSSHNRKPKKDLKIAKCLFCGKQIKNPKFCSLLHKQKYYSNILEKRKLEKRISVKMTRGKDVKMVKLDITNGELEKYRLSHTRCEICEKECDVKGKLSIDHDHKTGKFRGLLCFRCNISLGHLEDKLDKAIKYLKL